jgi:hypothetical protein
MNEAPSTPSTSGSAGVLSDRFLRGVGWGILATIVMSLPMMIGMRTGFAPMPQPIPLAIAGGLLGSAAPQPVLMLVGVLSHLAYGGAWGGILAISTAPVTIPKGIGLGIFLWLLMQVIVLPLLGWGVFGTAITPEIAAATLVLHLIYGITVGWLVDR